MRLTHSPDVWASDLLCAQMATTITANIRQAIRGLEGERKRIDEQIEALQRVLAVMDGRTAKAVQGKPVAASTARKRRGMSAKARQAARERMKAYWAKRKAAKGKKAAAKQSSRPRGK